MSVRLPLRRDPPSPNRCDGSALIEFVGVSVILLVPIVYLLLSVFQVQRGAFAASQAAREAGRAFATAPTTAEGMRRAQRAAELAFQDQGIHAPPTVRFLAAGAQCSAGGVVAPRLEPGARFTVCVSDEVFLPYADKGLFADVAPARIGVTGKYTVAVDSYREAS